MKELILIVAAAVEFAVILTVRLRANNRMRLNKGGVNHKKETAVRVLELAPCIGLLTFVAPSWLVFGSVVWLVAFAWLTLFDGLFSKLEGFGFWALGTKDGKEDAFTDQFFRSVGPFWHKFIKLVGCAIGVVLYALEVHWHS